ncbi:GNAT family N-acetyltransferase [Streptomyces mayteni]
MGLREEGIRTILWDDPFMGPKSVSLRRIELTDWRDVHSWACLPEACRFQPWGPNTEEQTRAFVLSAAEGWAHRPQRRFAFVARFEGAVVGMGELRIRSVEHRQGEIAYIVHPKLWGAGLGTAIGAELLRHGFGRWGCTASTRAVIHGTSRQPRSFASSA